MSTIGGVAFHPLSTTAVAAAGARPAGFFFAPQTAGGALGVVAAPASNASSIAGSTPTAALPAGNIENVVLVTGHDGLKMIWNTVLSLCLRSCWLKCSTWAYGGSQCVSFVM